MSTELAPVGVREAKNRFSELAAEVNATGQSLVVLRNNKPWVTIVPADVGAARQRRRAKPASTLRRRRASA